MNEVVLGLPNGNDGGPAEAGGGFIEGSENVAVAKDS